MWELNRARVGSALGHGSRDQVQDMNAFVIHYCIIIHIKITIQSLYCDPLPYCDHNTDSPFLFFNFFYNPPL